MFYPIEPLKLRRKISHTNMNNNYILLSYTVIKELINIVNKNRFILNVLLSTIEM